MSTKHNIVIDPPIGPKKTIFVMITVIGCLGILWPKVFYPMMFGGLPLKQPVLSAKDHRNNIKDTDGIRQERPPQFHPDLMHPAMFERGRAIPNTNTIPIVPGGKPNNKQSTSKTRVVEGRPGPIPGLRPPMGAGVQQAAQKTTGGSMGFIMPLYTIGIIIFFVYTILKLIFKNKPENTPTYATESVKSDPIFKEKVFNNDSCSNKKGVNKKINGSTKTKIGWDEHSTSTELCDSINSFLRDKDQINCKSPNTSIDIAIQNELRETEKLLEVSLLKKKLRETEKAMDELRAQMVVIPRAKDVPSTAADENDDDDKTINNVHQSNGISPKKEQEHIIKFPSNEQNQTKENAKHKIGDFIKSEQRNNNNNNNKDRKLDRSTGDLRKKRDTSGDRTVKVVGMEMSASCEGGQKWGGRPQTPVLSLSTPHLHSHQYKLEDDEPNETQSIFLEGSLPHESQILVADSETKSEGLYKQKKSSNNDDDDDDEDDDAEEPAVVLSSKMILSLINMDPVEKNNNKNDNEDEDLATEELISEEDDIDDDEEDEIISNNGDDNAIMDKDSMGEEEEDDDDK